MAESDGHGLSASFDLDAAGNVESESVNDNGAQTTRSFTYAGQQLTSLTQGSQTQRYFYDPAGNVDCVTTSSGTAADCALATGGSQSVRLLADYSYDYLNRLSGFRSFQTNGSVSTADARADYRYDALDRPVAETEQHGTGSPKTLLMSYLGLSDLVVDEQHTNSTGQTTASKSYGFDPFGRRFSLTTTSGGSSERFTFGHDPHGSVSLLLDSAGQARASYGYRAYGATNSELTKGDTTEGDLLNPYRYTGKRLDTGSSTLDMGARRFSPDSGRFLQQDGFPSAAGNLGLAYDPLTANRYALAGGNPVGFVEIDGHCAGHAGFGWDVNFNAWYHFGTGNLYDTNCNFISGSRPDQAATPFEQPPAQQSQPAPAPASAPAPTPERAPREWDVNLNGWYEYATGDVYESDGVTKRAGHGTLGAGSESLR